MATPRLVSSFILRASRSSVSHPARQFRALQVAAPRLAAIKPSQFRSYSEESPKPSKIYSFSDVSTPPVHSYYSPTHPISIQVKAFSEKPDPNRILIDTREPSELQTTGTIPGSINIPVTSQPDAFFITAEEFEDRFGFERPGKDLEVVFYCKSGVRSRGAAELARQAGWGTVAEYPGSWLDWEKNGGGKEGGRS
jgi:rhodanese-related sulfurtransferase